MNHLWDRLNKTDHNSKVDIDLHIHSKNSDGMETTDELMQRFKEYSILSFTDHDSVQCYYDLAFRHEERGTTDFILIPGVELSFAFHGQLRDMLGYGIDIGIINDYLRKRYTPSEKLKKQQRCLEITKEVFRKKGLIFDEDLEIVYGNKSEAYVVMYHSLIRHPENLEKYGFIRDNGYFYRHYYSNSESDFFVDETYDIPAMDEVVKLIHSANGLAFLAHPCAYSNIPSEWMQYIGDAIDNGINGIEVYHYSANESATSYLQQTAIDNDLYISGGSDFHETSRESGFGKTRVPWDDIKKWIPRVTLV